MKMFPKKRIDGVACFKQWKVEKFRRSTIDDYWIAGSGYKNCLSIMVAAGRHETQTFSSLATAKIRWNLMDFICINMYQLGISRFGVTLYAPCKTFSFCMILYVFFCVFVWYGRKIHRQGVSFQDCDTFLSPFGSKTKRLGKALVATRPLAAGDLVSGTWIARRFGVIWEVVVVLFLWKHQSCVVMFLFAFSAMKKGWDWKFDWPNWLPKYANFQWRFGAKRWSFLTSPPLTDGPRFWWIGPSWWSPTPRLWNDPGLDPTNITGHNGWLWFDQKIEELVLKTS